MVDYFKFFLEKSITMINLRSETRAVETPGYIFCERKEDGNGGVVGTEAMLDGWKRE